MKVEIFPVDGKRVEAVWLHPPKGSLIRGRDENFLTIPAGIYNKWSLVVRTHDGELHGLGFGTNESMVRSGRNPLYEKMLNCKKLDREECLTIIAYVSREKDLTAQEKEEWETLCERKTQEAEERARQREARDKASRRRQYEGLRGEFG